MACDCNPCSESAANSAANETIASQIENFTKQFFGTVVKTEVDGTVTWSLPCSLDVGLENNPRAEGEGLGCYFLRLFEAGIIGLTGPQGEAGANGAAGRNAYTVTVASFTQPSLVSPVVAVTMAYNPAIVDGIYVFISTSGWYVVSSNDGAGVYFLTLTKPLPGAPATITAGKLVVVAGYPGESITGPQGPQGTQGVAGDPAEAFTTANDQYDATIGSNHDLQIIYGAVDFVNSAPQFLLPAAGRYLVSVVADVLGLTGVASTDSVSMKLFNTTNSGDIAGSEHIISNVDEDERKQVVITCIVETDAANQTIALYGKCSSADVITVVAVNTTLTYVRIE